jgi:hypothetical protein
MRRSKKIILIALLTVVVLAGSIGGIALAADNEEESQPKPRYGAMLDRVCEIYKENTGVAIDAEELQKAFTQAGKDLIVEARDRIRQRLIEEGKVTQEQLDEYDKWLESKPDVPFQLGPRNHGGVKPFGGGFRSFGGFGGWCEPQATG